MANAKYSISEINRLSAEECFSVLRRLVNSSLCDPILKRCIKSRPFKDFLHLRNSIYMLFDGLSFSDTLNVLRSNDVLGAKPKDLTGNALQEQIRSGLQNLSGYDSRLLDALNEAYLAKFSFHFICVTKNLSKNEIMNRFEKRISNDFETEFLFSIVQLKKLLHLRLLEIVDSHDHPSEPSFFMEDLNGYADQLLNLKS